jgi:hypothetical protein
MNHRSFILICVFFSSLAPTLVVASEGKWTPQQVLQLDPAWLQKQGLEIPPAQLWDETRGTGLLAAAVSITGCSAGFVSPDGLILTNHHCLFGLVQEHSTPARDLITHGFLARGRGDELPSKTMRVTVPRRFTDVTAKIESAAASAADATARTRAIQAAQRALVAACEKAPDAGCRVAAFDGGLQYMLIETVELQDVRLVYAPPRAIGEYGGEIDNWMWPRHTGDFSIARAYVSPDGRAAAFDAKNVPYRPEFHFPIAKQGVAPGDFVMVLGYPGVTYRSLIAEEMAERRDRFFPWREKVFGEWIRAIETATADSADARILVADDLKSLHNRYKNAQGQVAGFRRGRIVEQQQAADDAVAKWPAGRPERDAAASREGLRAILQEQLETWERDFLLSLVPVGLTTVPGSAGRFAKLLYHAVATAHLARERARPEAERTANFADRDVPRLKDRSAREERSTFLPADREVFALYIERLLALPEPQRVRSVEQFFGTFRGAPDALRSRIDKMYAATKLTSVEARDRMLDESEADLRARQDPFVEFGFAFDEDLRALRARQAAWEGRTSVLRPAWRRAVIAHAGQPVAPDANSTLRVSFAHVQGYSPRDAVTYGAQTTLSGAIEKHTGEEPFDLPERVRAEAPEAPRSRWADRQLGDVPIGFLADGDTTGGNSGSPVVNGRGELVGLNFDRVWENVANDFGYNPDIARNVSVDVRYMLWMLDEVEDAVALLQELGLSRGAEGAETQRSAEGRQGS